MARLNHLVDAGLNRQSVQRLAASGRLHRIYRAVYSAVPPRLLSRNGRYLAAVLAAGDGALLSHHSAAALLGLRPNNRTKVDVTVPGRSRRTIPRVNVHRSTTLTDNDRTTVSGIPTTATARTLLDLATHLDRRGLEKLLDQAEILGRFDLVALRDVLDRNPTALGAAKLRQTLAEHYPASTVTRSDFEELFFALVRTAGLPMPESNAYVVLPDGGPAIEADFLWREQRLIVEADGFATHGTRLAFERDRYRDQRVAADGWRVIRVTWRQLTSEADRISALIGSLLGV